MRWLLVHDKALKKQPYQMSAPEKKVFAKVDLEQAYHQILMDDQAASAEMSIPTEEYYEISISKLKSELHKEDILTGSKAHK